jgi:hypothetical protein
MGHLYHNDISFLFEELETLTHYGKLFWEGVGPESSPRYSVQLSGNKSLCVDVKGGVLYLYGTEAVIELRSGINISEHEFDELVMAVRNSFIVKEPLVQEVIAEVKGMYDELHAEKKETKDV